MQHRFQRDEVFQTKQRHGQSGVVMSQTRIYHFGCIVMLSDSSAQGNTGVIQQFFFKVSIKFLSWLSKKRREIKQKIHFYLYTRLCNMASFMHSLPLKGCQELTGLLVQTQSHIIVVEQSTVHEEHCYTRRERKSQLQHQK